MKRILAIFKLTSKEWMRSKTAVFFSFLFPIMLLLIFGTIFGGDSQITYTIYIQNKDIDNNGEANELSKILVEILNKTEIFNIKQVPANVDAIQYVLKETRGFGERPRLLIIPEKFTDKVINGTLASQAKVTMTMLDNIMKYVGDKLPEEARRNIEEGKRQLARLYQTGYSPATLLLFVEPNDQSGYVIKGILDNILSSFGMKAIGAERLMELEMKQLTGTKRLTAADYYVPGLIAAFIMTNGILGTAPAVSEYRRRGVIKRLAATPLRRYEWILGNLITQAVMGFALAMLIIAVGYAVFGVRAVPGPVGLAAIALGAVLFSGIGLLIAGLVRDIEAVSGLANAVAFPMMFLSGTLWPLEMMPEFMQQIARYLPLTYLAESLRADLVLGETQTALANLVIILSLSAIFIIIGSLTTRWREE